VNRYRIAWHKDAYIELAIIWNESSDKNSISTAAQHIDEILSVEPASQGRELSEGLRKLYAPPLEALFYVEEYRTIVWVALIKPMSER
jgi:hypothetical protein